MTIGPGTKLGRYEIRSQLGAGGMGEVYRARDDKLNRDVAIKVLPAAFSQNADRLRRFEQEAQAAGALNHPNILAIHDVDTHDGYPFVVSELLEGETLREQVSGTTIPTRKAIDYGLQIANGLAAAHEKGIVHRDLKPENLFITKDGRVKILDFGIAKLIEPRDGREALTDVPTRRMNTDPGVILGTVGYMSPEQVRGRPVDHRTDIFSFGTVLYEMLYGKRAFSGDSAVETLNAILKEDPPDLSRTNSNISPALERVVRHCLEKRPEQRFQSARDVAFALEAFSGLSGSSSILIDPLPHRAVSRELLTWITAGVLVLVLLAALPFVVSYFRRGPAEVRATRFTVPLPESARADLSLAISPDGHYLAFTATDADGRTKLWLRPLESLDAKPLPGTEDAAYSFWSPDSHFIAFHAGDKLKKIDLSGGPPETICDVRGVVSGTWGRDGVIVFGSTEITPGAQGGALFRVLATGGELVPLTTLDEARQEISHQWPWFLPDGRHFLYRVRSAISENIGIYVGSLDSKETKRLVATDSNAAYSPPGYLIFAREGALLAQPFDANTQKVTGEPVTLVEQLQVPLLGYITFSASDSGALVYRNGAPNTEFVWFNRAGKELGTVGPADSWIVDPFLSPDEKRVAAGRGSTKHLLRDFDIWLLDLSRGNIASRFTFDPSAHYCPVWSPDGRHIIYASRPGVIGSASSLMEKPADGVGDEEALFRSDGDVAPLDWSTDGRYILFEKEDLKTKSDLWVLPTVGERKPIPFLLTPFDEHAGVFSPDGHRIAYTSDESGRWEIYVRAFPTGGEKVRVSTGGGADPHWRRDGKELFYLAPDFKLMAVEVSTVSGFTAGDPKPLFETRVTGLADLRNHYVVTGDGQRFLVSSVTKEGATAPITVVLNWAADLRR